MKMKRSLVLALCLALCAALSIGGTLAYLTDRDSETNVFTMGDVRIDLEEDFEQGAQLIPGKDINKVPTITNTGSVDAYVWYVLSIPADLDTIGNASKNVVHFNWTAATTPTAAQANLDKAIANGWISSDVTLEMIKDNNMTWTAGEHIGETTINGVACNQYLFKYNKKIAPGETTLPSLVKVYLDHHIDIDREGNVHHVENGVVEDINWNINEDGFPVIYLAAYGVQAEGMDDVDAAYAAYTEQWGNNGGVTYDEVTVATPENNAVRPAGFEIVEVPGQTTVIKDVIVMDGSDAETNLRALYKEGGLSESLSIENCLLDGTYAMNPTIKSAAVGGKTLTAKDTTFMGWVSYSQFDTASFTNCTFKLNSEATYNFLRAYDPSTFVGCEFTGTEFDVADNGAIVLKKCTYNGKLIETVDDIENITDAAKAKITINNK